VFEYLARGKGAYSNTSHGEEKKPLGETSFLYRRPCFLSKKKKKKKKKKNPQKASLWAKDAEPVPSSVRGKKKFEKRTSALQRAADR